MPQVVGAYCPRQACRRERRLEVSDEVAWLDRCASVRKESWPSTRFGSAGLPPRSPTSTPMWIASTLAWRPARSWNATRPTTARSCMAWAWREEIPRWPDQQRLPWCQREWRSAINSSRLRRADFSNSSAPGAATNRPSGTCADVPLQWRSPDGQRHCARFRRQDVVDRAVLARSFCSIPTLRTP